MGAKRYLVAFGAAGLVFAGVYGAAAALTVDGGAVQAGSAQGLQCDSDGVQVASYRIDAEPAAVSSGVRIVGINPGCGGERLFATVSNDGTVLGNGSTALTGGEQAIITWEGGPVDAASINKIDLAID